MQPNRKNDLPPLVIVAGGKGIRMGDLTQHIPKALVKVANKPFLFHQINSFALQGIKKFIIASGYQHNAMLDYLKQQCDWPEFKFKDDTTKGAVFTVNDLEIIVIDTGEESGNAGRVKQLKSILPQTFVMTWCDNISDVNLHAMLDFHINNNPLMTMLTINPPERFGVVNLDGDTVSQLNEKTKNPERWINAGLFAVNKTSLDKISSNSSMWEFDVLPNLIKNQQVLAYKHTGYWQCMDNINDRMIIEADILNNSSPLNSTSDYAYFANRL